MESRGRNLGGRPARKAREEVRPRSCFPNAKAVEDGRGPDSAGADEGPHRAGASLRSRAACPPSSPDVKLRDEKEEAASRGAQRPIRRNSVVMPSIANRFKGERGRAPRERYREDEDPMSFQACASRLAVEAQMLRERRADPRSKIDDDGESVPTCRRTSKRIPRLRKPRQETLDERQMRRRRDGGETQSGPARCTRRTACRGSPTSTNCNRRADGFRAYFQAGRAPGASARNTARPSVSARGRRVPSRSATARDGARSRPREAIWRSRARSLSRDVELAEATRAPPLGTGGRGMWGTSSEGPRTSPSAVEKIAARDVEERRAAACARRCRG